MSLRCAVGLHAWEKWSAVSHHIVTVKGYWALGVFMPIDPVQQSEWRQSRACSRCGEVQTRKVAGPAATVLPAPETGEQSNG